jgi:hypothetical protein
MPQIDTLRRQTTTLSGQSGSRSLLLTWKKRADNLPVTCGSPPVTGCGPGAAKLRPDEFGLGPPDGAHATTVYADEGEGDRSWTLPFNAR